MIRRIKRLVILYLVSAAIFFGFLFFTSLPPNLIATLAWKHWGVEVLGVKGSLFQGVTASRLKWKSDRAVVSAEEFRMESVSIIDFILERRFEVSRITLAKLHIRVLSGAERTPAAIATETPGATLWRKVAAFGVPGELRLGSLSVTSGTIQAFESAEPTQLERMEMTDLRVSLSEVSLAALVLKSSNIDFQLSADGKRGESGELKLNTRINATLPASGWSLLKSDAIVTGTGFVEDSGKFEFRLSAFDGKILASADTSGTINLESRDWSPAEALNAKIPLQALNFFAQISPGSEEIPVSMNFKVGNASFAGASKVDLARPAPLFATHSMEKPGGTVIVRMNPGAFAAGRGFEFESNSHSDIGEILSYLHFNKPYALISVDEKSRLAEMLQ